MQRRFTHGGSLRLRKFTSLRNYRFFFSNGARVEKPRFPHAPTLTLTFKHFFMVLKSYFLQTFCSLLQYVSIASAIRCSSGFSSVCHRRSKSRSIALASSRTPRRCLCCGEPDSHWRLPWCCPYRYLDLKLAVGARYGPDAATSCRSHLSGAVDQVSPHRFHWNKSTWL